jgi:hypothetical protein
MKLTKEKLLLWSPCSDGLKFAESCDFDFAKIYSTCDRGDWLIWLLRKRNLLKKKLAVEIAVVCAKHVLGNYEKKYPDDLRPRKAIEAAKNWLKNPTAKNKNTAAASADAAYYAADAAASAAAYAYAAASAAASADADAYADAYAYAADYAADAAAERKWQADQIRKIVKNPFK